MLPLVGMILVLICILGSYVGLGGNLLVLWQPYEVLIIFGTGLSAYIIANRSNVLRQSLRLFVGVFKGPKYKKQDYQELLILQFQIFRLMKQRGALAIEQHIDNVHESPLFANFPKILANTVVIDFICDYLRLISLGVDNAHTLETIIDEDIEAIESDTASVVQALYTLADSFPALGIVAAVLGVIKTMGSITEPPEVLGHLIAGALVGTFLGVLLSYGWFSPLANATKQIFDSDKNYLKIIKIGLLSNLHGQAPSVSIEMARKTLAPELRPSFEELEDASSQAETPQE